MSHASAAASNSSDSPVSLRTATLRSPAFLALLGMQALTVINDNIFRWLVVGIGKQHYESDSGKSLVLSLGTVAFVLPFLLLAAPAGYLADRFAKRRVILVAKFAEILLMSAGIVAIYEGSLGALMVVLALMGAQAALFSPAKMGCIPELFSSERISSANGLMGLVTVISTVIGAGVGNWLTDITGRFGQERLGISASVLIGIALVGWLVSWLISSIEPAPIARTFPWNPLPQTYRDIRALARDRSLLRVALGVAFFWSLGALAQLNIDCFAFEKGAQVQTQVAPLLAALALGVGVGSVLAGVWSNGRVELGIVPLGGLVIAATSLVLCVIPGSIVTASTGVAGVTSQLTGSYYVVAALLFLLGVGAGLFDVPLEAYLQDRSPAASRGSILAASNFITFTGITLVSLLFAGLRLPLRASGESWWRATIASVTRLVHLEIPWQQDLTAWFTSSGIFLLCGLLTVPVCCYIVYLVPQATIRLFVFLLSKTVYRIHVHGLQNLPASGPALLTPNHISWLDGFLLILTSPRPVRPIAWTGPMGSPWTKRLANLFGTIPIDPGKPKSIVAALRTAREALLNGEVVVIFPEGGISRTGMMQAFRPGMLKILEGTNAPVIPVYLGGLWGSIFSFSEGKFFWKKPQQWPYRIDVYYGERMEATEDVHQVRTAVQQLGSHATNQRIKNSMSLTSSLIRRCKARGSRSKVADSLGTDLSGSELLLRTLILRRLLRRKVLKENEEYVGVLLPPSAGGVIVNAALALDRRVSVNLNYTVSSDVMNTCIELAGIRHVLTTRKFLEKFDFKLCAQVIFIEDFKNEVTLLDKIVTGWQTYGCPAALLEWSLGLAQVKPDDVLTIIFTSGSTGVPNGVMLTYGNVVSNVSAIDAIVRLTPDDVLIGVLPFFHSFGYTVTLWSVLALNIKGAYHFNPLDPKQVGDLCRKHKGTVLLATPTFLRTYLRRCDVEQLQTVDVVVAGAEKLPLDLVEAFEKKFNVRPAEGYGTTELSPLVSVNVPASRSLGSGQVDRKEGTVGRPIPGVTAKVTDLDTGVELPVNQPGMLWITGPNVMKGYLHRQDLTNSAIKDGWYCTGDVAKIDEDGFITITGRESRFSKIGGEMVPHVLVEEHLNRIIATALQEEEGLKAVVTSVADERKGERLIVVHTTLPLTPDVLQKSLMEAGLPNIYIPSPDSYVEVEHLPILGTGKLDLKGIKQLAVARFGPPQ
ncbi:MAG: acyl-[ACP]--phospholipid O-acyltransferase [Planctomycetota bacterium]